MRPPILFVDTRQGALDVLARLGPGVVIADVENTVVADNAGFATRQRELRVLATVMEERQLGVMYVSNAELGHGEDELDAVAVLEHAKKPFTSRDRLRRLAGGPIVAVWGDQPMTDGVLAFRLGVPFVRQRTSDAHSARNVARRLGGGLERLLFTSSADPTPVEW